MPSRIIFLEKLRTITVTSVRVGGIPADIRAGHLRNINEKRYCLNQLSLLLVPELLCGKNVSMKCQDIFSVITIGNVYYWGETKTNTRRTHTYIYISMFLPIIKYEVKLILICIIN
jgi:hypothetical protein